ncbi:hypothetical protein RB195_004863 [Necator americanus]|uniref:Fibronectin type-III domain-containing protein n=1 Tax=Necator americanus TaxID=51031 RepID=A0ABR1BM05_NECAM
MLPSEHVILLLLAFPVVDALTSGLSRLAETPKHFYQVRSLIVCRRKCEDKCSPTNSLWQQFGCNRCVQECIQKENMIFEDGPQDRGLIRAVVVCCARLVTHYQVSAKIYFDLSNDVKEDVVAVLEYRKLSSTDDLYSPSWIVSQIIRDRSVNIADMECGFIYQFRLTLINSRIIDRRTSSWISNSQLCRYELLDSLK